MSKTLGFYLLELYFRKSLIWPISRGLQKFGAFICITINIICSCYPLFIKIINYKKNFGNILFHFEFIMLSAVVLFDNILAFRYRFDLLEMISLLSDFELLGVPNRLKSVEENMKIVLKLIRYGGFFLGYFMAFYIMIQNDCGHKICFIVEYYEPFELGKWEITVIVLFQIYTVSAAINIIFFSTILFAYSLELLILRIENLKIMIKDSHFTTIKQKNHQMFRPIVLYHQYIFRKFKCVSSFYTSFVAPTKFFISLCLTMAITAFVLENNVISFFLILITSSGILLIHVIAQRFTTAAGSVAEDIYNMNWYEADVSTRKDVLILLCMSQKPLIMDIPLFGELSHLGAANEYKKVYLFYNWIIQMIKKKIV